MDDKVKEVNNKTTVEEKEQEIYQTLIIEDVKYKTRLNKKFLTRKTYEPVDPKKVLSFIPGTIRNIYIKKGNKVKEGQKLLELEAMKMVNTIFAGFDGVILDVPVKSGEVVTKNQVLVQFK